MTKQDTVNQKRSEYLDKKITHDEYYLWLSNFIGLPKVLIPASNEEVKRCLETDEHLNNIPLSRWDARDSFVRLYAGGLYWSLSDTVCCLKAMAKKRAE